jgi:hypothetical protein
MEEGKLVRSVFGQVPFCVPIVQFSIRSTKSQKLREKQQ